MVKDKATAMFNSHPAAALAGCLIVERALSEAENVAVV